MNGSHKALKDVIRAWDSLPTGDYPKHVIEFWLAKEMKPAIDAARLVQEPQIETDKGT